LSAKEPPRYLEEEQSCLAIELRDLLSGRRKILEGNGTYVSDRRGRSGLAIRLKRALPGSSFP
jgi:hypothetical protein